MRLLIVNNLKAGPGDAAIYDFMRAFNTDGDEVVMRSSDTTTSIESLVDDATDFDAVVVAGGDGTVTSVCYALRDTDIPILPFPSGTANILCINLDYPTEPVALAQIVRTCDTLDFDIGELEIGGRKCGFAIIAGAGYDASIMENATKLKATFGESAYFLAALSDPNPTIAHFTLELDGRKIEEDGIVVLLVNFGKMMFDISFIHGNNPRDGLFEVAVVKSRNTRQLVPVMFSTLLDRDGRFPSRTDNVDVYYAKEVSLSADPPLNIQYDGEPTRIKTPLSARILPASVRLIVDRESAVIAEMEKKGPGDARTWEKDTYPEK